MIVFFLWKMEFSICTGINKINFKSIRWEQQDEVEQNPTPKKQHFKIYASKDANSHPKRNMQKKKKTNLSNLKKKVVKTRKEKKGKEIDFDDMYPNQLLTDTPRPKEERFHVVQNFLVYTDPNFKESVKRTPMQSKARQKELDDTLIANLKHPSIAAIHIMYTNKGLLDYLDRLQLRNHSKLKCQYFDKVPTISMFLLYIQKNLQNKYAIVSNQDIEYGEGWDEINLKKMKEQNIMYALSRNVKKEHLRDPNCYAGNSANCNPGSTDNGSYDLFAFYVHGNVPKDMIAEMDYTQAKWGMENVFVWYAIHQWGYHVMNPCKVLMVYHIDCHHIGIKGRDRQRSNHIETVGFTDKLYKTYYG